MPSLVALGPNGYFVTWSSANQTTPTSDLDIYGQIVVVSATGTQARVQNEFRLNSHISSYQYGSSVATFDGDQVFASWTSYNQDGSYHGIYGQLFSIDRAAAGISPSSTSTDTGKNTAAVIAVSVVAGMVVVVAGIVLVFRARSADPGTR